MFLRNERDTCVCKMIIIRELARSCLEYKVCKAKFFFQLNYFIEKKIKNRVGDTSINTR